MLSNPPRMEQNDLKRKVAIVEAINLGYSRLET